MGPATTFDVYQNHSLVAGCETEAEAFQVVREMVGDLSADQAVWLQPEIVKVDRRGRARRRWNATAIVGTLFDVLPQSLYVQPPEEDALAALRDGRDLALSRVPAEGRDLRGWWDLRLSFTRLDPATGLDVREHVRFRSDHSRDALEPLFHEWQKHIDERESTTDN